MKEASFVSDCFPLPPTPKTVFLENPLNDYVVFYVPTSIMLPLGCLRTLDILTKWSMASGKNTKSIPDPLTISLNCDRNISKRSKSSCSLITGSYTFGNSASASSPSSPVGSGASLLKNNFG